MLSRPPAPPPHKSAHSAHTHTHLLHRVMAEPLLPTTISTREPYVAYFSDKEEEEEEGGSATCGTEEVSYRPDWMKEMGARLMNAKVGEVIWPGTHDSGAHCEQFDFSKVVHTHWLRFIGTYMIRYLGQGPKQFASDWSRAQGLNIRQQLKHGVRFLDLRVSKCRQDSRYYMVHTFCGPPLKDVLVEIHDFLTEHRGECVLVSVVPVCDVDHIELHGVFERHLGEFLLKRERESYQISPLSLTLSHLTEKGRLVVFYKLPAMFGYMENVPCFWDSRSIHAPFVQSLDPTTKETHQLENFTTFSQNYHKPADRRHKHLFHFMYALIPTLGQILKSADVFKYLISPESRSKLRSLQECAQVLNPKLGRFVERVERHAVSEQCQDMGVILSVDFVEESDLIQLVISLNQSRFKNSQILS